MAVFLAIVLVPILPVTPRLSLLCVDVEKLGAGQDWILCTSQLLVKTDSRHQYYGNLQTGRNLNQKELTKKRIEAT